MPRVNIFRLFALALLAIGLSGRPSSGQTMQQLRTCQGKTTEAADSIIRACSVFIETRHAVGGRPIPKTGLGGVLELRGNAYNKKADYDRAIADYNQAIQLNITNSQFEFLYNRGNAYFAKKDFQRAAADYDESIRLKPKFAAAHINRGNVRVNNRDYDSAIADYTEALQIDPGNALAKQQLQGARLAQKMDEKWIAYLQKIQDDGDDGNWSGPALEAFRRPK
jgi:tetratricopeptide (TPR) repeat protein